MFRKIAHVVALGACVSAAATVPAAHAVTTQELPALDAEPVGAFPLSLLLEQDPLGDTCIPEEHLDLAFYASGKGTRLPRTCLPDPCAEALTPVRLASLMGRPVPDAEWDRYFSRYADACRKEVTGFGDGQEPEVVSREDFTTEFWAPILPAQVLSPPAFRAFPTGRSAPRPFFPAAFGSLSRDTPGGISSFSNAPVPTLFSDPEDTVPNDVTATPEAPLATMPLPFGIILLLTSLLGLRGLKRLQKI